MWFCNLFLLLKRMVGMMDRSCTDQRLDLEERLLEVLIAVVGTKQCSTSDKVLMSFHFVQLMTFCQQQVLGLLLV
jgi:hypothetical protein